MSGQAVFTGREEWCFSLFCSCLLFLFLLHFLRLLLLLQGGEEKVPTGFSCRYCKNLLITKTSCRLVILLKFDRLDATVHFIWPQLFWQFLGLAAIPSPNVWVWAGSASIPFQPQERVKLGGGKRQIAVVQPGRSACGLVFGVLFSQACGWSAERNSIIVVLG